MATLYQLHELVHSLDKNEKKYISMMIEGTAGKAKARYADAFRDVNAVKKYDAVKLKQHLAAGVSGMNLSEANTNFYRFICKSLISYHTTDRSKTGLQSELLLIELLVNKALYETAHQMLQSIVPKVNQAGSFSAIHHANELQNSIYINYKKLNKNYEERYRFYQERLRVIDEHRQAVEITMLNMRFFHLAQTIGDPRTKAQQQQYVDLANNPLMSLDASKVNIRILATFVTLKLTLNEISGHQVDLISLCKKMKAEVVKRYAHQDSKSQEFFIVDFMSSMIIQKRLSGELDNIEQELRNLLESISQKGIKSKILARILMLKLSACLWQKKYDDTDKLLAEWMDEKVKAQWLSVNLGYVNLLLIARIFYLAGQPDKALDYLLMLQPFEKSIRPNILISYRFLTLLCHYKLHNYQYLTYATESLYRYLLKLDKLYAPERALLRFVKKSDHFEKVRGEMKILLNTFEELEKDPLHSAFFLFGDYLQWLNMEISAKRF